MQIKLLKTAEMADAVEAWRLSRDPQGSYDVDAIAAVDAPVMEFPTAMVNFENFTIAEREIICSLRNHTVWARTSRVDDPRTFTCPEEFISSSHINYRARMYKLAKDDVPQDIWRMQIPLVAHTNWSQRISLRDLARLAVYFGHLSSKAEWPPLAKRFAAVQYKIVELLTLMLGGRTAHALLQKQPVIRFLFENRLPSKNEMHPVGHFKTVFTTVNIALRAQIVRHREIQFVDDFWALINSPDLPHLQLVHQVRMQLTARNDVWQAVCSKRACWIAQADLWQPLINAFGWSPPLPCTGKKTCPFEVDARARLIQNADPNPPCPVFMNLYRLPKEDHKAAMMVEAKRRGDFWVSEVNK